MKTQKVIIKQLLNEAIEKILSLNDEDLKKIEDKSHYLTVELKPQINNNSITSKELTSEDKQKLVESLQVCKSREEGMKLLSKNLNNKKELEQIARYLDVSFLKQDKVDQIRELIVEATIGAILNSEAIQGNNDFSDV